MRFRSVAQLSLLVLLAFPDTSIADDALDLEVSVKGDTVTICLTNQANALRTFYNSFALHRDGDVPRFTYVIAKRKDGSIVTSDSSKDGRYSPLTYSSFEFRWKDVERQTLRPGETITYSAPLSKFFYKPPWQYRFGFSWVKLGCRVYTKPPNEYVDSASSWVEVDYKKILQDVD